jgi:hypothetical protein
MVGSGLFVAASHGATVGDAGYTKNSSSIDDRGPKLPDRGRTSADLRNVISPTAGHLLKKGFRATKQR